MTLAKPVMRGLLTAQIKKNLIVASILSIITVEVPRAEPKDQGLC